MTGLTGPGVRVLLIATADYSDPALPSLPPVARSAAALAAVLRERCGVAPEQLAVLLDPPDAKTMAVAVTEAAHGAASVLVIYYLGHGLVGPGGELYLSASGTGELTPGLAAHQALPFAAITEAVSACQASCVVVVLDCCFSGRAAFGLQGGEPVFTLPATHGVYLLASAERLALAPPDEEFTMFSGALIGLLTDGDPRGPGLLTLDDGYDFVFRTVRERGGPLPRRQAGDRSGELVLASNPAARSGAGGADDDAPPSPGRSPYLGLSPFGLDDAELFRGRERLTGELVTAAARALAARSPLVVVGPSGAGKSSLLQAGLLARLREGPAELPGAAGWPWLTLTPGEQPLRSLAARLSPDRAVSADDLRRDPARATGLAAALLAGAGEPGPDRRLVLVIDQLEQLFAAGVTAAERAAFLAVLWAVAGPQNGGAAAALVVLALRADFYGRAAEHQELLAALTDCQFLVGPMTPAELRAAIEEPAEAVGLTLDAGLADVILAELGAADGASTAPGPGGLPLLSHALWAIWQRRSGSRLTMAGYRGAGRVAGAIATSAAETYASLEPPEQDAARRMLPRLVRVGDDGPDTGRELDRGALLRGLPSAEAAQAALDRLAAARLVTLDRGSVRLSHETLLRSWPLLAAWVDDDREWLKVSQRLADDARAWQQAGQDRSRLYRGGTLAAVRERAATAGRTGELPADAASFFAASVRQERRAGRRRIALMTVLSVLLALALAGGGTTLAFQRQAVGQRNIALAQAFSAEAGALRVNDPNLALQLSLLAYQTDSAVGLGTLLASEGSAGTLDDGYPALDIAQQGNGAVVAISTGSSIRLVDARTGRYLGQVGDLATGPVALAPGRHLLVAAVGPLGPLYPVSAQVPEETGVAVTRDEIRVWSIAEPGRPRLLATVPARASDVVALALSANQRTLATASLDGVIRLWDVADPQRPVLLSALPSDGKAVYSVAFDPRAGVLASTGADHQISLWNVATPAHPVLLSRVAASTVDLADSDDPAMAHRLAFSADGRYLAGVAGTSASAEEYPEIWDVSNPRVPREYVGIAGTGTDSASGSCSNVTGLWLGKAGNVITLVAACTDSLEIFQPSPGQPGMSPTLGEIASLSESQETGGGQVLPISGPRILSAGPDGVTVWDPTSNVGPGGLVSLPAITGLVPGSLAVNSSGPPLLADTANISAVQLWDLRQPGNPRPLDSDPAISPAGTGAEINALAEGVALSGNGKIFAAAEIRTNRPVVAIYPTAHKDAAPLAVIRNLSDGAIALALSSTGDLLAVADNSNYAPAESRPPTVKLYSLAEPARPRLLAALPANSFRVLLSPDNRMLVVLTANLLLSWNVSDPSRPVELPVQRLSLSSVVASGAFAPDGALLAVADSAGTLRIWRVAHDRLAGSPAVVQTEAGGFLDAVAFSPDGQTLATAGLLNGDSSTPDVDLWSVAGQGNPRLVSQWAQPSPSAGIDGLAFSLGAHVLLVETDDAIYFWSTDPGHIRSGICASVGDTMTPAQWKQYVPGLPYRPPCARP